MDLRKMRKMTSLVGEAVDGLMMSNDVQCGTQSHSQFLRKIGIKLLQNYLHVLEKLTQLISLYLWSSPTRIDYSIRTASVHNESESDTLLTSHRSSPSIPTLAENGSRGAHDGIEREGR